MPIYEYSCKKCGHSFEELVFGSKLPPCPKCGSAETSKLMSCPTLHCSSDCSSAKGDMSSRAGGGCAGCAGKNCASCH